MLHKIDKKKLEENREIVSKMRRKERAERLDRVIERLASIESVINEELSYTIDGYYSMENDTAERIGLTKVIDKLNKIYVKRMNEMKGE